MTRPATLITMASMFLLGTACGVGLDATNGWDDTGSPVGDAVNVVSIVPDWGPIYGGTEVTIRGDGLVGEVEVFFGNARLEVTQLDDETLKVTSPNAGAPLAIDVTVRSDLGEDVVPAGFTFSDTGPPPDTGDTDTDTSPPTGTIGGYIEFSRTQVACPTCLGMPAEFQIMAGAAFHQPIAGSWVDWLPPMGQCALNPDSSPPVGAAPYIDAGQWAYLMSGSTNIPLQRTSGTGGPAFSADNIPLNDYISNGSYDLEVPDGGAYGPFNVTGVMRAAEGYDSITPIELLFGGEAGAFTAQVSSAGQNFTWSPAGSGDGFMIDIGAYDYFSGAYLGHVVCHGPDSGSMFVPTGDFMDAPLLLTVGMYRRKITHTVNPADGNTIEAIATAGFLGTAAMEF